MTSATPRIASLEPALFPSLPRAEAGVVIAPTPKADDIHRQLPEVARAFYEMVSLEPLTGVGVLSLDGRVLYINEQGARLLVHDGAKSTDLVGRKMSDFYPPEIIKERLEVFRRLSTERRPVLVRTLWNGRQLTSRFRRIPTRQGEPEHDVILVLSRLIPGDLRTLFGPDEVNVVYTSYVRLGPLDCLSTQELRVMAVIGAGMTVREAAKALFRAEKTIETHCTSIHRKLGLRDRVEVTELAQRAGLTVEDAERRRV